MTKSPKLGNLAQYYRSNLNAQEQNNSRLNNYDKASASYISQWTESLLRMDTHL